MLGVLGLVAQAQEQKVWVQIDAQPTLSAAMDRARAYAGVLEQVQGYRLPSGAYAIVLGPMGSDAAVTELQSLMAQNMIAADSVLADGQGFGQQFWPVGAAEQTATAQSTETATEAEVAEVGNDFILVEYEGRIGGGGASDERSSYWRRDGKLLATSEQLVWYRKVPPRSPE